MKSLESVKKISLDSINDLFLGVDFMSPSGYLSIGLFGVRC